MALILSRSVMILVPKTASTWCHQVLFEQGLVRGVMYSAAHYPHPSAAEVRAALAPDFTFCFVRHPVAWLRSYWAAAAMAQGRGEERVRFAKSPWHQFSLCESPRFVQFVEKYLRQCPGEVGRLFGRYTDGVDFVGHYEALLPDLERAAIASGEPIDIRDAAVVPPVKAAPDYLGELASLPRELHDAICSAESGCIAAHYA